MFDNQIRTRGESLSASAVLINGVIAEVKYWAAMPTHQDERIAPKLCREAVSSQGVLVSIETSVSRRGVCETNVRRGGQFRNLLSPIPSLR